MDTLPQELIDRIVCNVVRHSGESHLGIYQLAQVPLNLLPLATISRPFQSAIESITFRNLKFKSTDLDKFKTSVTGNRRAKVHEITYSVELPTYSNEACAIYETVEDQRANNESYSQSLKLLFDILKSWDDDQVAGTITLYLSRIYSPMDFHFRDKEKHSKDDIDIFVGTRTDLLDRRYNGSLIQLLQPERLPLLNRVSALSVSRWFGPGGRRPAPCMAVHIAARLPLLKRLDWDLDDLSFNGLDSVDQVEYRINYRVETRHALAQTLGSYSFSAVEKAKVDLYHQFDSNHIKPPQVLLPVNATFDPLSAALRRFSQNLTSLYIEATIDSGLFWPTLQENDALPLWPSLKTYDLKFDLATPAGQWYFTGDPPPGSSPRDQNCFFRTTPNTDTIEPLLTAFGKAMQRMPALEVAQILCPLHSDEYGRVDFSVSCLSPGTRGDYDDEGPGGVRYRRVDYIVGAWRPSLEVERALGAAGGDMHGGRVIHRYWGC